MDLGHVDVAAYRAGALRPFQHGATGRAFHVPNVVVARIRDGRIVSTRDYHNHLVLADALGRLPDLVAAFQAA